MKKTLIYNVLEDFLLHIDSIKDTAPMTTVLLEPHIEEAGTEYKKFLKESVEKIKDKDWKKKEIVKLENHHKLEKLQSNYFISLLSLKIIHESLFISLISQYDNFFGNLLKEIYKIQPAIINSSEKTLTFSELSKFDWLKEARKNIIEREVESVIRENHIYHFTYLENHLGIKLTKLSIWKDFIELTERRNLFAHCDWIVSTQYINNCSKNWYDTGDTKVWDKLNITPEYLRFSHKILYEISVKLVHTISRKINIEKLEEADNELNNLCYKLLSSSRFELADTILDFAVNQKKHFDSKSKDYFILNHALSKSLNWNDSEASIIIKSKDWSSCSDYLKLAKETILNNYETVYELMLKIWKNENIEKHDYQEWPLFYKIRREKKFQETFKKIYWEEYKVIESPNKPIQKIIKKIEIKKENNSKT